MVTLVTVINMESLITMAMITMMIISTIFTISTMIDALPHRSLKLINITHSVTRSRG